MRQRRKGPFTHTRCAFLRCARRNASFLLAQRNSARHWVTVSYCFPLKITFHHRNTAVKHTTCLTRLDRRLLSVWARGRCRISRPRVLAECCKRQLNQGSYVLLYFRLSTFSDLYWVCLSVFSCILFCLSCSISQVIGCEDRIRNDQYCVEWGVKLYSMQLLSAVSGSVW